MSHVYECPDCHGRVLHLCQPPAVRGLPRNPTLRRLRRVDIPEVEGTTLEEAFHDTYQDTTPRRTPPPPAVRNQTSTERP